MSDQLRKVKNPLLTAAGQGFPFEDYSTNALLMPVTPATPAILQDVNQEESSLGQESIISNLPQARASTEIGVSGVEEFGTIPLQSEPPRKDPVDQPARQGYFTSILSSLPNLSLSSITGDSSSVSQTTSSQQQQPEVSNPGVSRDSNTYGLSQNPYGTPSTSGTFVAADQSRESLGHYSQGFSDIGLAGPPTNSVLSRPPPSVPTLPPSGGPGSYRLGNQRRLKYAPPPDLTSNNPKQYPVPPAPSFLTPTQPQISAVASDFLIPNATFQTLSSSRSSPGSLSNTSLYSGAGALQGSQSFSSGFPGTSNSTASQQQQQSQQQTPFFPASTNLPILSQSRPPTSHYNPELSGWSGVSGVSTSSPQEIPSRIPEPATPQNTPANSSFASFATSYATNQSETLISGGRTKFAEGLTFEIPSSSYQKTNTLPISGGIIEPNVTLSTNDTPATSDACEDSNFTPISAAKITAKLEHLLAERAEDSSPVTSNVEPLPFVDVLKSGEQQQQQSSVSSSGFNQEVKTSEPGEDLAEIDLNAIPSLPDIQSTQANTVTSQISSGLDSPPVLGSETFARPGSHVSTPAEANVSSRSSSIPDSLPQKQNVGAVPTGSHFFNLGSESRKPEVNYFSTTNEASGLSAFYNPQTSVQNQQPPSSFFTPGPPNVATNVPSPFFTSTVNSQQNASAAPVQTIPTLHNPGFVSSNRDLPFSVFTPQISSGASLTQSPFSQSVLSSSPPSFPTSGSFMATAMPEPTGSATLNPVQMSVNPGLGRGTADMVPPSFQSLASGPTDRRMQYRPVYHHWFYRKEVESKTLWLPFSMQDSLSLEEVHNSSEITPETTVATDGGRYDVDILRRRRTPVYWIGNPTEVRRSSWFYKGSTESRYIPYEESISARLEEEYKQACTTDHWDRRIELNNGEYIVFHSSTIQVHYVPATSPELAASWGNSAVSPMDVQTTSSSSYLPIGPNATLSNFDKSLRKAYATLTQDSETGTYLQGAASRPKVVKRGVDEFNIDEGEPEKVDHLLFLVHGIGSVCDLKFRTVEEVVDEFRSISLQLVQSHYRTASMHGVVNRIEVLPISWHTTLHSEDTGIDKKLRAITLESIPKLRHFTNDTLLDILFYTSPIYCQTIMQTVGNEMNKLYSLFKDRNPNFGGSVYLGGHSLGSLILFDLLCHQKPPAEESRDETDPNSNPDSRSDEDTVSSMNSMAVPVPKRRLSKKVSYVMGAAGTGQPFINYPQLSFLPQAFFALGSPIGMFVTVRGIDTLGEDFALPTCPAFFNVFHPFDPVAYRVESLINPDAHKYRPMLIPHHKGRKRMHLELKETMARVGADLKQKLLDSVRSTWNSVYQLAMFHRPDNQSLEREIDKVVEEQLHKTPDVHEQQNDDDGGADFRVGKLNGGRRIDYVLQEAPFEYINEYIFALTSHVCYWESEDTMLMILKEIYGTNGIQADAQLPPQTMTIERVSPSPSIASMPGASTSGYSPSVVTSPMGIDPTAPITTKSVGPPPISGFVRKS